MSSRQMTLEVVAHIDWTSWRYGSPRLTGEATGTTITRTIFSIPQKA